MTETETDATELVRRLEAGFGGKKLSAGVRAEYVEYLDRIGAERAERVTVLALRTLRARPSLAELVDLDLAAATHPAAPPPAPPKPDLPAPLPLDLDDVPDQYRPGEHDRPASREYARYWSGRIRDTLAASAGNLELRLPELEPDATPETDRLLAELTPDELEADDLEPF